MIVGIDFDNTLVNYEGLFHDEAVRRGLISRDTPSDKCSVRDALRKQGCDEAFTLLQGYVYGVRIVDASAYPDTQETIKRLIASRCAVHIVSHKTRFPYYGVEYDLHQAAYDWLEARGFFAQGMLAPDDVFLETSLQAKIQRITALGCTWFIDDLPEFLAHPDFPSGTGRILFDPQRQSRALEEGTKVCSFSSWETIYMFLAQNIFGGASH